MTGGGAFFSSRSGSGSAAGAGASAGAAAACAPSPFDAASTSALTIRPPGPVPWRPAMSSPSSRAIRRATGDALMRPLPPSAGSGAGSSRGGSGARSSGGASAVAVAVSASPPSSSPPSSDWRSAGAAPFDSPPSPIRAIVSPTASVSPSWATIDSVPS
jgi:hypothetical protein